MGRYGAFPEPSANAPVFAHSGRPESMEAAIQIAGGRQEVLPSNGRPTYTLHHRGLKVPHVECGMEYGHLWLNSDTTSRRYVAFFSPCAPKSKMLSMKMFSIGRVRRIGTRTPHFFAGDA